jgi:broad specificity phosphatase PhoE
MPHVDPSSPAESWQLGADGRAAARRLAPLVDGPVHAVASPEPKAVQTLEECLPSSPIRTDPGFAEVRRPHEWTDGDTYRATARAYVQGRLPDGWERQEDVVARFDAAVVHHAALASAANRTLVIGTHGLATTLWLAGRFPLLPSPERFWERLRLPDLIDVDLVGHTLAARRDLLAG